MNVRAYACGFLLSTALTVNAGERLTIAVSPRQSYAPSNLTVRVHVTPDANNRGLEVSADSGEYFRSSLVQLDGKDAPQTITVELRSLPGGTYEIRGTLVDTTGRARAFAHMPVIVLSRLGGG
jgi:hypothetical protein